MASEMTSTLRIAMAQFDFPVGDVAGNAARIAEMIAFARDEYAADTHPGNSNSLLRINRAAFAGNVWHVDWQGGSNAHQIIQCSSNLLTGWTDLLTNHPPTPLSNQLNRSDTSPTNKFFIRVKAHR